MKRTFSLYQDMGFGKYSDQTLIYVINNDPSYVRWCLENIAGFTMTQNARRYYNGDEAAAEEEDEEVCDYEDNWEFHRRSGMHDDWYDDFDDDGAGWDVYQGASDNPYYNDQLDLDQQSDEFWECL